MADTCPKCGADMYCHLQSMRLFKCGSWRDDDDNSLLTGQANDCKYRELTNISRKLAAKLVLHRGADMIRCHACGAWSGEPVKHNDGCPVVELEAILGEP